MGLCVSKACVRQSAACTTRAYADYVVPAVYLCGPVAGRGLPADARGELECQCVLHTYAKTPMHARPTMQMTARAFCKMRDLAAGLGVMLVGKGGDDGEAGGASPSSSGFL